MEAWQGLSGSWAGTVRKSLAVAKNSQPQVDNSFQGVKGKENRKWFGNQKQVWPTVRGKVR